MIRSWILRDARFFWKARIASRRFKIYLFFPLPLAFPAFCHAQIPLATFEVENLNYVSIGEDLPIKEGFRIVVSEEVQNCIIDSINNIAYLTTGKSKNGRFKGGGRLWAIGIKEGKPLWSKFINFNDYRFFLADSIPLLGDQYQIARLNRNTGRVVWQKDYPAATLNPDKSTIICTYGLNRKRIVSLDIGTGAILSEYKAGHIENIADAQFINDTTLFISAQGIYRINISDGTGWHYESMTSYVDRDEGYFIAWFTFGVPGLTIYYFSSPEVHRRLGNLQNNYLLIHEDIFLVSFDKLSHLKKDGTVERELNLPYQYLTNGLATLFDYQETIYVVYYGRNALEIIDRPDGFAYIAAYKPGEMGWKKIYKLEEGEVIVDHVRSDSKLTIVTSNRIIQLDLVSLELIRSEPIPDRISALGLRRILPPTSYVEIDSLFTQAINNWPNRFLIQTENNQTLEIQDDLTPLSSQTEFNMFRSIGQVGNFQLIQNRKHAVLIGPNGARAVDFQFSKRAHFYGNMIIDIQENEVIFLSIPTNTKN